MNTKRWQHLRTAGRTLVVALALVAVSASSANALYVALDPTAASTHDDLGIVITEEKVTTTYKIGIFGGGTGTIEKVVRTVEFTDGPMLLTAVDLDFVKGKGVATTASGDVVLDAKDGFTPIWVEKLEFKEWVFGDEASAAIGIDLDVPTRLPSQPIPEPGAALLFGAGLFAVALKRR